MRGIRWLLVQPWQDLLTHDAQFSIKLSEFLSIDPQHDRTISLETERLHVELKKAIRRLALYRYVKAKGEYVKLTEDMRVLL